MSERKIRVSPEVIEASFARTHDGAAVTAEWGEPDAEGFYNPIFTRHDDDRLGELDAAWAEADSASLAFQVLEVRKRPDGWLALAMVRDGGAPMTNSLCEVTGCPTPAAALRALTAKLRGEVK